MSISTSAATTSIIASMQAMRMRAMVEYFKKAGATTVKTAILPNTIISNEFGKIKLTEEELRKYPFIKHFQNGKYYLDLTALREFNKLQKKYAFLFIALIVLIALFSIAIFS